MSVIVILDGPKNQPKCKKSWEPTGVRGQNRERLYLNDVAVDIRPGGIEIYVAHKIEEAHPATAFDADTILGYSVHDHVKTSSMRRTGRYRLRSAEITVDEPTFGRPSTSDGYWITGFTKNLEDLQELYRLIRAGEIAPFKDYEVGQVEPITGRILRFIERLSRFERMIRNAWRNRKFQLA